MSLFRTTAALALIASGVIAQSTAFDPAWGLSRVWDDGQCEVAQYDAVTHYEGRDWTHSVTTVACSEVFSNDLWVKADHPDADDVPVIKLNLVLAAPTGAYETRVMSSVFIARTQPQRLVKETTSTQEWCGTSFFEVEGRETPPRMTWSTYWDGNPSGARHLDEVDERPFLTWEQLLISLRALRFEEGLTVDVNLLDALHDSSRLDDARARAAVIAVVGKEMISLTNDVEAETWRVEVDADTGPDTTLWFSTEPDHLLLRLEAPEANGIRSLTLIEGQRMQYW